MQRSAQPTNGIIQRLLLTIISFLLIVSGFLRVFSEPVHADDFGFAAYFLERTKVSTSSTPILVVIEPSTLTTSRTETTLRITFKAGFTVNATASAIQTSTSGLPATFKGYSLTAMPGLSAIASGVSGQQVEFSVSDLADGNYYAFYITSGITNPSSAGNYSSPIATRDGSGDIDTASPGIGIESNDQISVTASIPPKTNAGVVNISGQPGNATIVSDGDVITYTVSYRNADDEAYPFEVVASWEKGTVAGTSSQVEVLDYVVGSASNTDGGVAPVVNLQNRRITWTISSLAPSNDFKTVTFRLKVRSDIPRNSDVQVNVKADSTISETSLTQKSMYHVVRFSPDPSATPFHPSATPGAGAQPSQPAQPYAGLFDFDFIRMSQITHQDAIVNVQANKTARVKITYGKNPAQLTEEIQNSGYERLSSLTLENLIPNTLYYFRVEIESEDGEKKLSDLLSFTTAQSAAVAKRLRTDILWSKLLLSTDIPVDASQRPYNVVVPHATPLTFNFQFEDSSLIEEVVVRIQETGVLGISTLEPQPNEIETQLIEAVPNQYVGELLMPEKNGNYQFLLTAKDVYGGFYSEIIGVQAIVTDPIRLVDSIYHRPVEAANVDVYSYSDSMKLYEPLIQSISYTQITDERGEIALTLPIGKYKVKASAIGYEKKELEFTIDESHPYPQVKMVSNGTFMTALHFYSKALDDLGLFFSKQLGEVTHSHYGRSGLLVIAIFITMFFVGTVALGRYHISLLLMPLILIYMCVSGLVRLLLHGRGVYVYATAPSTLHSLILGVNVKVYGKLGVLLKSYTTDIAGSIYVPKKLWDEHGKHLRLATEMEGFRSTHFDIGNEFRSMKIRINESHKLQGLYHILDHVIIFLNFGFFFSGILLTSIMIVWMLRSANIAYAMPFCVLNVINFIAMYIYVKDVSHIINERGYI